MCTGPSPKAPPPPPKLPEAPITADPTTSRRGTSADQRRRRAMTGESSYSTILTGPRGVQSDTKTILGG